MFCIFLNIKFLIQGSNNYYKDIMEAEKNKMKWNMQIPAILSCCSWSQVTPKQMAKSKQTRRWCSCWPLEISTKLTFDTHTFHHVHTIKLSSLRFFMWNQISSSSWCHCRNLIPKLLSISTKNKLMTPASRIDGDYTLLI